MENSIVISVIIPTYNVETLVRRAAESVINQMNDRIELILVNDGSTDNSGAVCDEYSKSYPGVRVVHKVNGGLSSARNAGMAVARGEYYVFLDADDYLEPNACEELIKVITAYHPDCIDFGWNYVDERGEITQHLHKVPKNVLLDNGILRSLLLPPLLHLRDDPDHFIYDFACMKVYRRQIIEENAISFNERQRIWEDRPFVCHYLKYCRNFYSMDQCLYNYVFMEGSLGQRYSLDFFRIMLMSFRHYLEIYGDEFDFDTPYVNSYWRCAIENVIYRSLDQTKDQDVIRKTILNTLRDEQVIHWYRNSQPQNHFEKKVSQLVQTGDVEKAFHHYKKQSARRHRQRNICNFKSRFRSGLGVIGRKFFGR